MSWLMIRPIVLVATLVAVGSTANAQTVLERGKYLVNTIMACGNCHTPKDSNGKPIVERELSGGLTFTVPPFDAAAANITPDRETGIGDWSDDDIKRAITHGIRPANARLSGVPLAAVMAAGFFKALLPEDQTAIVAYLRSVKPVRNSLPNPVYRVPVQHDHYPEADAGFTKDMMRDPVKRGSYLVTIGHCMECHSPRVKGVSDYSKTGLGKGGRIFSSKDVRGFRSIGQAQPLQISPRTRKRALDAGVTRRSSAPSRRGFHAMAASFNLPWILHHIGA